MCGSIFFSIVLEQPGEVPTSTHTGGGNTSDKVGDEMQDKGKEAEEPNPNLERLRVELQGQV